MFRALAFVVLAAFGAAGQAQMIDDFESYADTSALQAEWPFANLLDQATPNPVSGTKSFQRSCLSVSGGGCASSRGFDPALDLSGGALSVWFKLGEGGPVPSEARVYLYDGGAGECGFFSGNLSDTGWHRFDFRPDSSALCPSFDATDVVEIQFLQYNQSGSEEVAFLSANWDDLRFLPSVFADGFASGSACSWSGLVSTPSTCSNKVQDGCETGIDCGGNECGPCATFGIFTQAYPRSSFQYD